MNLFNYDNPIFQALTRIFDVVILNILWIICSIPIITAGAATTALYYSLLKINRETDSSITGMFFKAFRQNLKQGCALTALFGISGLILYVDVQYSRALENSIGNILFVVFILTFVLWGMMVSYAFPLLAQFDNTIIGTLKNSFFMSIIHFWKTIIIVLLNASIPVVFFVLPELFILGIPVWLSFGIAGVGFINAKLFTKIFDSYIENSDCK